jgi:hypothetical protein
VEVDNAALSLACLARVFHGASVEDSSIMARKAIEIAGADADEVDLLDALDDVWAASILAGTMVMGDNLPVHPMSPKEQEDYWQPIMVVQDAKQAAAYGKEHVVPKRYKDANLVSYKKKRAKKRRQWDKS